MAAAEPLEFLNIDTITYAKFFLDSEQKCNGSFFIKNHIPSVLWHCQNVFSNGSDYEKAIRRTRLNELCYFIHPAQTNDFVISSQKELFGLTDGLTIYNRTDTFIESWERPCPYLHNEVEPIT
jgi:hypothetical protein